ncbi:hypothetical protein ACFL41_00015 [Gemmatimonadota bacterium]
MVRRGGWKKVENSQWRGRFDLGRAFLLSADETLARAVDGQIGDPIMSNALLAAIAYADALTIKFGGILNQQDHARLIAALQSALGNRASKEQLNRLGRLLKMKNQIQYDHTVCTIQDAREYVGQVRRFASWAETELARP